MLDVAEPVYMRVLSAFIQTCFEAPSGRKIGKRKIVVSLACFLPAAALVLLSASCVGGVGHSHHSAKVEPIDDGVVRGVVRNAWGWELEGLRVVAQSEEGYGTRLGLTDAKGLYWIEDLWLGTYTVQVLRGTHVVAERRLEVRDRAVDTHFIVPAQYLDRPDQRDGPIVDSYFIRTSHRE